MNQTKCIFLLLHYTTVKTYSHKQLGRAEYILKTLMLVICTFACLHPITDDPKPPGPVELDQNISGTVTLSWPPSPDEKRDDRLHYMVSKRDSFKRTWRTVADNLFNNKFTVINILPGREYYFRVFAKNDMGLSPPSESPVFGTEKEKGSCLHTDCPTHNAFPALEASEQQNDPKKPQSRSLTLSIMQHFSTQHYLAQ